MPIGAGQLTPRDPHRSRGLSTQLISVQLMLGLSIDVEPAGVDIKHTVWAAYQQPDTVARAAEILVITCATNDVPLKVVAVLIERSRPSARTSPAAAPGSTLRSGRGLSSLLPLRAWAARLGA